MSPPLRPKKKYRAHPADWLPEDRTRQRNRIHTPNQAASLARQYQIPLSKVSTPDGSSSSIAPLLATESAHHSAHRRSPASRQTENNPPPSSQSRRLPTAWWAAPSIRRRIPAPESLRPFRYCGRSLQNAPACPPAQESRCLSCPKV